MSTSTSSISTPTTNIARLMRRLYFVRAGFAIVWAIVLATTIAIPILSTILLIIYPAFDAGAALFDARVHGVITRISAQTINVVISILAVIAVLVVLPMGVPALLRVFGVWASKPDRNRVAPRLRRGGIRSRNVPSGECHGCWEQPRARWHVVGTDSATPEARRYCIAEEYIS